MPRKHFPPDGSDPDLVSRLNDLWIQKKGIEEELRDDASTNIGTGSKALEKQYSDINSLMFSLLQPSRMSVQSTLNPRDGDNSHLSTSSSTRRSKWDFQGVSFLIYLQTSDVTVPWTAWDQMPVALLVPAAVSVLTMNGKTMKLWTQFLVDCQTIKLEMAMW